MGFAIFGGVAASTKSLIVIGAVAVASFLVGHKIFRGGRDMRRNPTMNMMSYAASSYITDTNIALVQRKIVQVIAVDAINRNKVYTVMDTLMGVLASYNPKIVALIKERQDGEIDQREYNAKLRQMINDIAEDAGIELREKPWLVDRKTTQRAPGGITKYYRSKLL